MEQKTITPKEQRAIDKVKRANAELAKIGRNQKKQLRREQNNHKYMMGGCVAKYFPDGLSAFDFDEQEMNRIIACAFSSKDGEDAKTIVDNCNSYVYMGGMDTELTKDISIRADKPSKYILNMPIGYSWIFRHGQEPVYCRNFDIEAFMQVKGFEYGKPAKLSYDLLDEISSERRGA